MITLIAYKPNSEAYCRGNRMESYDSDFQVLDFKTNSSDYDETEYTFKEIFDSVDQETSRLVNSLSEFIMKNKLLGNQEKPYQLQLFARTTNDYEESSFPVYRAKASQIADMKYTQLIEDKKEKARNEAIKAKRIEEEKEIKLLKKLKEKYQDV